MNINIEQILKLPYKDTGAYRVPEGYFENLPDRIMSAIPSDVKLKKSRSLIFRTRTKYMIAACMTGVICGVAAISFQSRNTEIQDTIAIADAQHEIIDDDYIIDCIDYAMLEKEDVYSYISEQ